MNLLVHVESKTEFFIFGEEEDEEMITCLTLLNGRVETDLENKRIKTRSRIDRLNNHEAAFSQSICKDLLSS